MGPSLPCLAPVLAEGSLNPLAFDPSAFMLTLIVFLAVLGLLLKYAWNPVLNALQVREERIEGAIQGAEKARIEAESLLAEYKSKLAAAERQVAERIDEARRLAEKQGEEIVEKARGDAQKEAERARRDIELQKQRVLGELRAEAVTLSRLIAERVLERELGEADHKRLADQVLAALD